MSTFEYPIVDSDSHVSEVPDLWTGRISQKWDDAVPQVVSDDMGVPRWKVGDTLITGVAQYAVAGWKEWGSFPSQVDEADPAAFDAHQRLNRLDEYGIAVQILYPNLLSFSTTAFLKVSEEFATECVRAYNDYMREWADADPDRLIPMVVLPFWDRDAALAEMSRCKDVGFRGFVFSNNFDAVGLPPVIDEHWDPVYAAAEEMSLPVNFHVGFAAFSEEDFKRRVFAPSRRESVRISSVSLMSNARAIADVISSGICHRYPGLNFVSVESGAGWMPYLLESMDWHWINFGAAHENPDVELPSYYFRRQVYGTFWFETDCAKSALEIMPDNLMFETDFPHPTSLSPGPASSAESPAVMVKSALAGQPDSTIRKILYENAAKVYDLNIKI